LIPRTIAFEPYKPCSSFPETSKDQCLLKRNIFKTSVDMSQCHNAPSNYL
jgi:hypothetical protein